MRANGGGAFGPVRSKQSFLLLGDVGLGAGWDYR